MTLIIAISALCAIGAVCLFNIVPSKRRGLLPLAFLVGGALCTVLRCFVIKTSIDPVNGFYIASPILTAFNLLIGAVLIAIFVVFFFTRKRSSLTETNASIGVNLSGVLGALAFGLSLAYCFDRLTNEKKISIPIAIMLFCGLVALIALLMTVNPIERKLSREAALVFLGPVVFTAVHLVSSFIDHITVASVSEYLFDVAMLISVLLFFYCDARVRATSKQNPAAMRVAALAAIVFTMVACLPKLWFSIVGGSVFTEPFNLLYACYALLVPYFVRRACDVK